MSKLPLATLAAIATLAFVPSVVPSLHAGLLYSETFGTDGSLADYTGAGKVFTATSTSGTFLGTAAGGELNVGLVANQAGTLMTYTDFGGAKSLLSMQIDYTVNGGGAASSGLGIYVGGFTSISDYEPGWNPFNNGSVAKVNSNLDGSRPITGESSSGNFSQDLSLSQTYRLTLYLNLSGSSQNYVGPGGANHTLDDGKWAFFVGNTMLAGVGTETGLAKGSAGDDVADITGMVLVFGRNWDGGSSNLDLDNITIRDDLNVAVPEPGSAALIGLGALAFLAKRRRC